MPRRSRVLGALLVLTVVGCFQSLGGPVAPAGDDVYVSEWQRIEAVREYVEGARALDGALPMSLEGLCTGSSANPWLCESGEERATRDRWGNPLVYTVLADGAYRIGTRGPDGLIGSEDDLTVDSDEELERVRGSAGCYVFELPDGEGELVRRLLALDTTRFSQLRAEWEAFGTAPPDAVPPKWHPWRHDSILVSWTSVSKVLDLRLVLSSDSLVGVAHSPTGMATWWDQPLPFEVRGARLDC